MSYQKTDKEIEEESNQLLQNVEQDIGGWRVVGVATLRHFNGLRYSQQLQRKPPHLCWRGIWRMYWGRRLSRKVGRGVGSFGRGRDTSVGWD